MIMGPGQLSFQRYGAHVVVTLQGDLDEYVCLHLDTLLPAILDAETSTVQLDVGGVTYLNSAALRTLVSFQQRAASAGVLVSIGTCSSIVRRLLEVVQLENMFPGLTAA